MNSTTFLISMVFVPQCVTVNILFTIILQVLRIALALMMQMTYTVHKTAPAGIEFLQLVEIIMEEEDWPMPSNYEEALDLYINLLNEME